MAGVNSVSEVNKQYDEPKQLNDKDPFAINEQEPHEQEIEEVFKNTFEKQQAKAQNLTLGQQPVGVKQDVFYGRIEEVEEDEERKQAPSSPNQWPTMTAGDELDEKLIKEQLRMKNLQHKPMLGLDESDESEEEGFHQRSHRNNRRERRPTEQNRQSQSQIFLQRKQMQMQNTSSEGGLTPDAQMKPEVNKQHNKGEDLEVEDIFNEEESALDNTPNQPLRILPGTSLAPSSSASHQDRYKHLLNTLMSEPDTNTNDHQEDEDLKQQPSQAQVVPPLKIGGGEVPNMVIDDSIMITERSMMVKGRQEEHD